MLSQLFVVLGCVLPFIQSYVCPSGYTLYENICYDFRNPDTFSTRADCQATCTSNGAAMLCLRNQAENTFIYGYVSSGSPWIGLEKVSGQWTWVGGCISSFENWSPAEGTSGEPYVVIWNGNNGAWADLNDYSHPVTTTCFCQRDAFQDPTIEPSPSPTPLPSPEPSRQPTSQPSAQPSLRPSARPTAVAVLQFASSKSYQVRNGFSFAALTSTGAVLYWAGDGTMAVQSVVPSGAMAATVNRHAVVALTASGYVRVSGIQAYARGYEAYESGGAPLVAIFGNEGAFAGITETGGVVAFGGLGNGNSVEDSGFAAQLSSEVIAIVASAGSFTALKSDGTVFTWGNKYCGGGVSSLTRTDLQGIVKVFATRTAFAGLTSVGKVLTWGDRHDGGDSSTVSAQLQSDVFHIVSSKSVFMAMKEDLSVVVWGNPWFGGDASAVAAELATEVTFVAHTSAAFAALREDGSVVTWGDATSGGDSSAVQHLLFSVVTVVGNAYAFAAITSLGAVVAWGYLSEGGLIPADLVALLSSGVTELFSTNRAFAALKGATGELVLWGNPHHGGDAGAAAAYLSSGVRTVCGNDAAFTAFLQDGRAVAWGHITSVPDPGLLNTGALVLNFGDTVVCV